jgi:6-phosphogluconolactonase
LEIRIFPNLEEISRHAAEIFISESEKNIKSKNVFTVSLNGGSTPKRLFELLATDFKKDIYWEKVHIFWGDERDVENSPESSFQLASKLWLEKILEEIPSFSNNIHRIKLELGLKNGAEEYTKEINKWTPEGFDLALNGAGSDGHRNGVMPENQNVDWKNNIWDLSKKIKVWGYKVPPEINPYVNRITVTPWFLNKSKTNILMLSGKDKASLLKKITIDKDNYSKRKIPAITFNDSPTIVLVDTPVLSELDY